MMKCNLNKRVLQSLAALFFILLTGSLAQAGDLQKDFVSPPESARPWCWWWWLNGAASKEGITRDLEEMRAKGIGGAVVYDAGMAGPEAPRGPKFMSDEWRELFKYAVREADRCGIVLNANLCSGFNAGGPWVTSEHAAKALVSSVTAINGPGRVNVALPKPAAVMGFYRDIAVLAAAIPENATAVKLEASSEAKKGGGSALAEDGNEKTRWASRMGPTPDKPEFLQFNFAGPWTASGLYLKPYSECGPKDVEVQCSDDGKTFRVLKRLALKPNDPVTVSFEPTAAKFFRVVFQNSYPLNGENKNVQVAEIKLMDSKGRKPVLPVLDHSRTVDVTKFMDPSGQLNWEAPEGNWLVLRLGYTLHGKMTKCVGGGPGGLEIDPMSAAAMDAHFAETGAKLIADAGSLAGKTLQYFQIDSWEIGQPTWTPEMREEFHKRRGYDPLLWLPAVLGETVDTPAETARFMQDYRRTVADLVAANYYGRLRELTVKGGLRGVHSESGGPFFTQWIDALQCEGTNDIPMGEFWKRASEPDGQITHHFNPSIKQAACAAHIYGKPVCQAEAFTSTACDWIDDPWSMKDVGDEAFCEGLTRIVFSFWVHQSRLDAKPGFDRMHIGTHFNPNLTWWPMSDGWLTYLARCQHMLRQGLFVADFAYLQSEAIPSFLAKRPDQRIPGFDYDVLNAEVLLSRATAKDGRLTLPDGMSYRYLILPRQPAVLSPATLKKIDELAAAGVTVISDKMPQGLTPDLEFRNPSKGANFDWIHRRDGATDIYFLSNQSASNASAEVAFRVTGMQPELWDAVTGQVRDLAEWHTEQGRTVVPLSFAPRQSSFVVFRRPVKVEKSEGKNFPELKPVQELTGTWEVAFDPKWVSPALAEAAAGKPATVTFDTLTDWTKRPEEGIRNYSGIATYRKIFSAAVGKRLFLDLGTVANVARVHLNGRDLGAVWTAPWRVEITDAVKAGENVLEIEVANLWVNRLAGDGKLPKEQRLTKTNVTTYDTPLSKIDGTDFGVRTCTICQQRIKNGEAPQLMPSGLLGPVRLLIEE